jgi:rhodanese-related sulfurtransferase
MREVFKNLYIGGDDSVSEARKRGMNIIHSCKDGPHSHRSVLKYESMGAPKGPEYLVVKRPGNIYLNLIDADDPSFIPDEIVNTALTAVKDSLSKDKPILIHCNHGLSRSPTIAFLYLYSAGKLPQEYHKALRSFRQIYPQYDPSPGLELYAKRRIREMKR